MSGFFFFIPTIIVIVITYEYNQKNVLSLLTQNFNLALLQILVIQSTKFNNLNYLK